MHMDLTITLGNLIQIAVVVVSVFIAYTRIRERLVRIETQLDPLWRAYERRRGSIGAHEGDA